MAGGRRVVSLIHFYLPAHRAGGEVMLHSLHTALVERGHEVHVIVTEQPEGPDDYVVDGVHVHRAGGGERTVPNLARSLAPDVVLTHLNETPNAYRLARSGALGRRVPVVQVVHNNMRDTKALLRQRPDLAVFNTDWVRRDSTGELGSTPSIVVHPPVRAGRHRTDPGRRVTLVNLNEHKGSAIFYALAQAMPDVPFLGVVGAHGRQVVRRDIKNVAIQEHTADMRGDVWSRTRLLLMPSVYESYGMTGLEAASCGIPTIAHPTPGLLESLSYAGTFVLRDDFEGLRRMVERVLAPTVWTPLSALARVRSAEADPTGELNAWASAFEQLAEQGPREPARPTTRFNGTRQPARSQPVRPVQNASRGWQGVRR